MTKTYAYARVSSRDQNLDRQIDAFVGMGIEPEDIFVDKCSGKDFEREAYRALIEVLREGDVVVIKSIDRLGRSYDAIKREWSRLVNDIRAQIYVLDMPLLDTRSRVGGLMGKLVSDIVLQLLSFCAENERDNIRRRQSEGIAAAKKRGVRFGRPEREHPPMALEAYSLYFAKQLTMAQVAERLGQSRANCYYFAKKLRPVIAALLQGKDDPDEA